MSKDLKKMQTFCTSKCQLDHLVHCHYLKSSMLCYSTCVSDGKDWVQTRPAIAVSVGASCSMQKFLAISVLISMILWAIKILKFFIEKVLNITKMLKKIIHHLWFMERKEKHTTFYIQLVFNYHREVKCCRLSPPCCNDIVIVIKSSSDLSRFGFVNSNFPHNLI